MKKITLVAILICTFNLQHLSAQLIVKPTYFESTGVSNDGKVAGYENQGGSYFVWNPDPDTFDLIGGTAPGNGVGGEAKFSADGNFLSGTSTIDQEISTAWTRNVLTDFNFIFKSITFPDNQSQWGYAAGQSLTNNGNGIVLRTLNGGQTWTPKWEDTNQRGIESMSFPTQFTGYVCGWNQYFAKTENGGNDWTEMNPAGTDDVYIYTAVHFTDDLNGVVAAQLNSGIAIYKTNDGGMSWSTGSGLAGVPAKITHTANGNLFLVTNGGSIQKSEDGGLNWTTVYTNPSALLLGIRFFNDQIGIATGETNIYKTTDGGTTWTSAPVVPGLTDGALWRDVTWLNDLNLVLIGTSDLVFESNDGGNSWTWANELVFNGGPALYEVVATNLKIHVCGSQGNFYSKSLISSQEVAEMSRYNMTTAEWTSLGNLGFTVDATTSSGFCISGDGNTVLGNSWANPANGNGFTPYAHAFGWNETEGTIDLGSLFANENRSSRVNAVSNNGGVAVGYQDYNGPWKSAVWRKNPAGGYFPNEYLLINPAGSASDEFNQLGECSAVSGDGNWIGGAGDYANGGQPWIWSETSGVVLLGDLTGGVGSGRVSGINQDGTVVIGWFDVDFFSPKIPFIWTPTGGVQNLNTFVSDNLGIPLEGKQIYIPNNLSLNGRFVVGWGFDFSVNEFGDLFCFRLELPENLSTTQSEVASINIYPNPTSKYINVTASTAVNSAELYSINGALLLTEKNPNAVSQIDISSLEVGMYILKIATDKGTSTFKVIKK